MRAGCISPISSDIVVSGSYDHSVYVWDRRAGEKPIHSFMHGCPVEAVMFLPNGTTLAVACGNEIKIWDLVAGNPLLSTISTHNKTVTSLGLANNGARIVSSSLDRQLKFHDVSTFQTVHSLPFPSPILSANVAVC